MVSNTATTAPVGTTDSPYVPRIGFWGRLLGPFHVTGVMWWRMLAFGARVVPDRLRPPIVVAFATLFLVSLTGIRSALGSNLDPVLGSCGRLARWGRVWRSLHNLGWCITERFERLVTDHPFAVTLEGADAWAEAGRGGRGFVLATAHIGMWEAASMVPSEQEARRVHVVREQEMHGATQSYLEPLLRDKLGGTYVTHFADDDPTLGIRLVDALRAGEVVALQGDRPRAGSRSVRVPLCGREIDVPAGPAALARAAGVPLVPVFALREGLRRYRVVMFPPIEVTDVKTATLTLGRAIEATIRRAPHQWFRFTPLWASQDGPGTES